MRLKVLLGVVVILLIIIVSIVLVFRSTPPSVPSLPSENIQPKVLKSQNIVLKDGSTFDLEVHEDYEISVAVEGLGRARFMAMSPDGRLFVTDMYNLSDNTNGKIFILSDFNAETHRFNKVTTYLSQLRNPNSIAFYKDTAGTDWLYIALTDRLIRYKYSSGDNAPTTEPEVLATFPDYGLSYKYGGWHLTRTIAFNNDKLYVSVGSSCNSCEEKENEPMRASILEMNVDGTSQKIYANGLRNSVGMRFVGGRLFATAMGSDHLGDDKPADTLYEVKANTHYGWPYCYEYEGKVYDDTSKPWARKNIDCTQVPLSFGAFKAHSAPLGLEEFDNSFLVALHGSGEPRIGAGYSIAQVRQNAKPQEFITGFLQNRERVGRPVDILKFDKNSFFFTDDYKGILYHVYKK